METHEQISSGRRKPASGQGGIQPGGRNSARNGIAQVGDTRVAMKSLAGKVAILTGAAGGQGRVEAAMLVDAGAFVVLTDISDDGAAFAASLGSAALFVRHDVASEADWDGVVARCIDKFGRVDILINNAGIYRPASLLDTDTRLFEEHYRVNQLSVFLGMRGVAPHMTRARSGAIVNIASGAGARGTSGLFAYSTSKWAVRGMTRSAARELAPFNIRVNAILPGRIDTPMVQTPDAGSHAEFASRVPLGRIGTSDEVARLVLFLAPDAASYITGVEVPVDGGYLA
jgi:3alpha(or 20beta)-hydroxysteroid dehydrogenase